MPRLNAAPNGRQRSLRRGNVRRFFSPEEIEPAEPPSVDGVPASGVRKEFDR